MKKVYYVISIIMLLFLVFLSLESLSSKENEKNNSVNTQKADPDEFLIGAYHVGCASNNPMQELGLNIWHRFIMDNDINTDTNINQHYLPRGELVEDKLLSNVTSYQSTVIPYYNSKSNLNNNYLYLNRPKIEMLSFAQRSDYHPFKIDYHQPSIKGNWWYGYAEHDTNVAVERIDNDTLVMFSKQGVKDSGYVVKGLRPTWEQVKGQVPNYYFADSIYSWYIKPKVKISTNVSDTTKIFRVEIYKKDGVLLKNVDVKRSDFGINYNGSYYLDEFFPITNSLKIKTGTDLYGTPSNPDNSKVDYAIFWYGNCDMWLERVRVENNWANELFSDLYIQTGTNWIQWEAQNIASNLTKPYKYLIDESEYNMYPAIGYLNQKINTFNSSTPKLSVVALNNIVYVTPEQRSFDNGNLWYDTLQRIDIDTLFRKSGMNEVFTDVYPIYANRININYYGRTQNVPNTLPVSGYSIPDGRFGLPAEPRDYENNFNLNIDERGHHYIDFYKNANYLSRTFNVPYITAIQIHSWYNGDSTLYSLREPTNEEIEVLAGIALTYGSKGIIYHAYNSIDPTSTSSQYSRGLVGDYTNTLTSECDGGKRYRNAYGQYKWNFIYNLTAKLKNLGKTIIKFKNTETNSYRYHIQEERDAFKSSCYVDNFVTFRNFGTNSNCTETNTPSNMIAECPDDTYLQLGTFKTSDVYERYLMVVNRRASPDTTAAINGRRYLRFRTKQNSSDFASFNNWKIIDAETNSEIATFDKRQYNNIDIPVIRPGEIKLYKFIPSMIDGDSLVADESVSGSFNCNGKVLNNGHNITISPNTTITFDTLARIEMNEGVFTCGEDADVSYVNLVGKDNNTHTWKGLVLSNCTTIGIYNTNLSKITANDTAKAVLISNCNDINIKRSNFNMGTNAGAIQAIFTSPSEVDITFNINNCNFDMGSSSYSAISIISNASSSLPVIIDWCNFSTTYENANAVTLSGVTGGAIKNNTFTNFISTINTLGSAIDLYSNTILGRTNSKGVYCVNGSDISLSPNSGLYLGGFNYFRNYGTSSSNINSDNSYFNINSGKNEFDLNDLDNSKFLTGTLSGQPVNKVFATNNCFHKDSITNVEAVHSVIWDTSSNPVNFIFTPYLCELTPPGDFFVFQYNGYKDTIQRSSGGESGGINPNKTLTAEDIAYKCLKDTININLRKRNYLTVEENAKQLLTQFPDSLESIGTVQKLYMASLSLDTTKIGLSKSFLENIIVTNTQNPGLVKRSFYFIQKCKVKLKQYQSALDGFQYIMTQNPYTYEGLVASWDYAATYLLMGSGGSYTGDFEQTTEELNTPADTLLSRMTKRDINTNKNVNQNTTKTATEQITKTFYEKIKNVTKDDKSTQEAKVKTLEKKIETSKSKTEKNDAETELAKMKQIKEVVKLKKPNTIVSHTAIINSDIKKVFGIGKGSKDESTNNLIPTSYTLYQNYPNPFNPVTKIAYDILGREMKTLVNNEFRSAGKYITEFNGAYLSSGIYFARILVNDGKDFMAVKKLVLLK
jgi:hypothetical protein